MRLRAHQAARSFSSLVLRGAGVTGHPPLNEPYPGVISPGVDELMTDFPKNTEISTLANGMRVATSQRSGGMCSVGVILDSGSRLVLQDMFYNPVPRKHVISKIV